MLKKIILLFSILIFSLYFFLNTIIDRNIFSNLKSFLNNEQKIFIKKYFFPHKYMSQQQKIISEKKDSQIIIKSNSDYSFQILKNKSLYIYSISDKLLNLKIKGFLNNRELVCYKNTFTKSLVIDISKFSDECKNAIFFIGYLENKYFYFGIKKKQITNNKNLLVLPTSNFYNYSGNIFNINQYNSTIDYFVNLNEIPFSYNDYWGEKIAASIKNLSKIFKDFDVVMDYDFQNIDLSTYNLIIFPLHQEKVSIEFMNKMISFLKDKNKTILSIGGANFMREVKFEKNSILFLKDQFINQKEYKINTWDRQENKNCVFLDDMDFYLGDITEPMLTSEIEYFFPKIKCENGKIIPLLSIQTFNKTKDSSLIHILSDGVGINFAEFEYLKSKILDEINNNL